MAGQPFSHLKTDGNYIFGTDALHGREHLTARVTIAIAGWSIVQAHLGNAFAELIGGKTPVAMSMYAAFDSFAVQRQLLITAVEELLPKRYSEVFRLTLKVIEVAGKERHRFAHWIWGGSTDPKFSTKILLLVEPRHSWRVRVAAIRRAKGIPKEDLSFFVMPRLDPKEIRAYTADDLERVGRQMELAWRYAHALSDLVASKPKRRLEIRRALLAQPEIHRAYDEARRRSAKVTKADSKPTHRSKPARRKSVIAKHK
ncbi:MAG: hypothetical protein Q8N31_11965 [Reyranella sp.]|nr:hypothetical protein [Reyranella sp.]MDP3160727.1 hypothetical protein [Reyranella sp.]